MQISGVAVSIHLINQYQKNWFRIDTLFIISYFIVYFQWAVMAHSTQIQLNNILYTNSSQIFYLEGMRISVIGLCSWLLGYNIFRPSPTSGSDEIYGLSSILLIFAVFLFLFVILSGKEYLTGSIYKKYHFGLIGTVSGYAAYVLEIISIIAIIIVSIMFYKNTFKKNNYYLALVVVFLGLYVFVFFMAGERGQILQLVTAIGVAYCAQYRPMRSYEFVGGTLAGAFIFSLLGVLRTGQSDNLLWFWNESGWYGLTQNLAKSVSTLHQSLEIVHSYGGFFNGQLWISGLLSPIPFAQSIFLRMHNFEYWEINSAYYLQYVKYGERAHTSDGTTLIGDIYINFGVLGVVLCMGIYGIVARYMSAFTSGNCRFIGFVASIIFASLVFYSSRGQYLGPVRPIFWGILLTLVLVRIKQKT